MKKEDIVLELFFNEPTKNWHFENILKYAHISRPQAAYWLKNFVKEGLIKRTKPRGRMPFYIANYENPVYQSRKRLFALKQFEKKGFLQHLTCLPNAKTIIIFGSFSRWDWYKESDIDVFIYGDLKGFDKSTFRSKLHREIETFVCKNKKDIQKLNPALLKNILEGYRVKGKLDFIEVAYA